ncbi:hypothetical protein MA16_Dca012034 [Dendrobium catenatum]|uniref:Uncharacterized protein n=1 Tax=Dendrobium catenatum TaxID=906689 RepID=A0A2I0WW05_9ASPA|nr:hypothetical protein MA16_Dca012034 [Dendrobium catenatum]
MRSIHHKIVDLAPVHILQELFDEVILARTTLDDCLIRVGKYEANGNDTKIGINVDGRPAKVALIDVLFL